jgi:hypothetical protein
MYIFCYFICLQIRNILCLLSLKYIYYINMRWKFPYLLIIASIQENSKVQKCIAVGHRSTKAILEKNVFNSLLGKYITGEKTKKYTSDHCVGHFQIVCFFADQESYIAAISLYIRIIRESRFEIRDSISEIRYSKCNTSNIQIIECWYWDFIAECITL